MLRTFKFIKYKHVLPSLQTQSNPSRNVSTDSFVAVAKASNMCACDILKRKVFEAVASDGAGALLCSMNLAETKSEVLTCSMVGFVTDLGNKWCDDLRASFWHDHFGG